MTTWTQLIQTTLTEIGEPEGIFHTAEDVQRYLEHGELLISINRVLVENTVPVVFPDAQPGYNIHTFIPDFIWPLRMTANNVPLYESSFASYSRLRPDWPIPPVGSPSVPESYAMIGTTMIAFEPIPVGGVPVVITYLRQPPTSWTTAAIGITPTIADQFQDSLHDYAKAICLGKEGQIQQAQAAMKRFMDTIGMPRDTRFLRGSATRDGDQVQHEPKVEYKD